MADQSAQSSGDSSSPKATLELLQAARLEEGRSVTAKQIELITARKARAIA